MMFLYRMNVSVVTVCDSENQCNFTIAFVKSGDKMYNVLEIFYWNAMIAD